VSIWDYFLTGEWGLRFEWRENYGLRCLYSAVGKGDRARQIEAEGELACELIGVTNGLQRHWAGVLTSSVLRGLGKTVVEQRELGSEGAKESWGRR